MQTLIMLLAETKSEAIIEMLPLLFGGVIIGCITLGLYYKSSGTRPIEISRPEMGPLKKQNINLYAEKGDLKERLCEKQNEIARFKEVNAKNVHFRIVGKMSGPLNNTKERKGIFYYKRLGLVHKEQVVNLTQIKGKGLWVEEKHIFDIYTFDQINKLIPIDVESITKVSDITPNFRVNWVTQVSKLAKKQLYQAMN